MSSIPRVTLFAFVLAAALAIAACGDDENGDDSLAGDDDGPSFGGAAMDICDYSINLGGDPYRCLGTAGFSDGGTGSGAAITQFCEHELACFEEDHTEADLAACQMEMEEIRAEFSEEYGAQCAQAFDQAVICYGRVSCEQLWDFEGCEAEEAQIDQTCFEDDTIAVPTDLKALGLDWCNKMYQCDLMSDAEHGECVDEWTNNPPDSLEPDCEAAYTDLLQCEVALSCQQLSDEAQWELCGAELDAVMDTCSTS